MTAPRIALIHAMPIAIEPTSGAFRELWPQARITIKTRTIPAATKALQQGRGAEHDRLIATAAAEIGACDALVLGQFSMARAATGIPPCPGRKVLTSPHSAVARLK